MNLTAIMPSGVITSTVYGLHQWDYGQELSIVTEGLPSLVEVHFACAGMSEAAVRVARVTDSTAVVTIPDQCLEQTTPITAWVYLKGDASGRTALEITLPIIARAKPIASSAPDDEARAATKYDDLFSATEQVIAKYEEAHADIQAAIEAGASAAASKEAAAASASEAAASASTAAAAALEVTDPARGLISMGNTVQVYDITSQRPEVTMPADDAMVYVSLISDDGRRQALGVVHLEGNRRTNSPLGLYTDSIYRQYYFVAFAPDMKNERKYSVLVYLLENGEPVVQSGTGVMKKIELRVVGQKGATI